MVQISQLPLPTIDARPMGAHRLFMFTDDTLFEACSTRIAFTTREGGVSKPPYDSLDIASHVGDDPQAVAQNRSFVLDALGAEGAQLITTNQVHGTDVLTVSQGDGASLGRVRARAAEGADAMVVEASKVAALLCFADCMPVVMVAPSGRFALAHAGWRGAVAGIVGKTLRELARIEAAHALHDETDAAIRAVAGATNVYIGPHIRSECFETGEDVAARFREVFGDEVLADERHVSLCAAARVDLMRAGCDAERIADTQLCTMCDNDRFFSYRSSGGTCGRHGALGIRFQR